eukprot:CAMPEP_0206234900 /NCGR_PEP_ID=MMETSP0047_2-20121206/12847_1 /ASSEMBLY_ACC=CAM_ASM_000192 /TAXON_ID=195065 /ORGANISM="Chroomonas mesostigmatica_cf, Strain CCMP1168" /LENGTH=653 /DNA_ID=CAMNT_0053659037 /DNA_START=51 /DNA_END=2012 /DNA_ORIENTATION=-
MARPEGSRAASSPGFTLLALLAVILLGSQETRAWAPSPPRCPSPPRTHAERSPALRKTVSFDSSRSELSAWLQEWPGLAATSRECILDVLEEEMLTKDLLRDSVSPVSVLKLPAIKALKRGPQAVLKQALEGLKEGRSYCGENEDDLDASLAAAGMQQQSIEAVQAMFKEHEITRPSVAAAVGFARIKKMPEFDKLRLGEKTRLEIKCKDWGKSKSAIRQELQERAVKQAVEKGLIPSSSSINGVDEEGRTPLMREAGRGSLENLQLLLAGGAFPWAQDQRNCTALHLAAVHGHVEAVDTLLAAGAPPDSQDKSGVTPLMLAAREAHIQIVESLLKANASHAVQSSTSGDTALLVASKRGLLPVLQTLLDAGAEPDQRDKNGCTALMLAAEGHLEVVKLLLARGSCPDLQDEFGDAVQMDPEGRNAGIVKALIEAGSVPQRAQAQENNEENIGQVLLKGIDFIFGSIVDNVALVMKGVMTSRCTAGQLEGNTALMRAADLGRVDIVEALLVAQAKADIRDKNGVSALTTAVAKGHFDVVEVLVAAGASVDQQAANGVTPLMLACLRGNLDVVEGLLAAGANPNIKTPETLLTPLMRASASGHVEIVRALLVAGADANAQDANGMTAMAIALSLDRPSPGVIEALHEAGASFHK